MNPARKPQHLRLGVNIDHVATVRNARGGRHPDPVRAAKLAAKSGADGITAHLREDRRHIIDEDIGRLVAEIELPLNLEMAATPEMLEVALRHKPHAACIVPEKRSEVTTEGGLDVIGGAAHLRPYVEALSKAGIRVSLFVDPAPEQVAASAAIGAAVVEIHTGQYCDTVHALGGTWTASPVIQRELERIKEAAAEAARQGLECHAGHGLTFETVGPVAAIPTVMELNIGHFLVGEAIFGGLEAAIRQMRARMDAARSGMAAGMGAGMGTAAQAPVA